MLTQNERYRFVSFPDYEIWFTRQDIDTDIPTNTRSLSWTRFTQQQGYDTQYDVECEALGKPVLLSYKFQFLFSCLC